MKKISKILAANRSEIAIRIFRAAEESGIKTAAIYSKEDRFAIHRFKTDESYLVGEGKGPIQAYLDIDSIIKIAKDAKVDAIHPGYGFLSESPELAEQCEKNDITFIGPSKEILKRFGNKTEALLRCEANKIDLPMMFLKNVADWIKFLPNSKVEVMGPIPAPMTKKVGRYRAQLLIQSSQRDELHPILNQLENFLSNTKDARKVRWSLDIDPVSMY